MSLDICKIIERDPSRITEFWTCFHSSNKILAQRAAWIVSHYFRQRPEDILPYLPSLIPVLHEPLHPAQARNILQILSEVDLPEDHEGVILDICYTLLSDPKSPIALRVYGFQIISNISFKYPEIAGDLMELMESLEEKPAGLRSRWKRIKPKLIRLLKEQGTRS